MHGTPFALAICGTFRMLCDILAVTDTKSCDSMPVPATKPRSSGRISVTGTPEGFCTPSDAQPATKPAAASASAMPDNLSKCNFIFIGYKEIHLAGPALTANQRPNKALAAPIAELGPEL